MSDETAPRVLVPLGDDAPRTVADIVRRFAAHDVPALAPFSEPVLAFCAALSAKIFADAEARQHPELQALAFWMRRAELARLKKEFEALETESTFLVPRGVAFHVPPANVDTIFVYSWLLSVLVGNRNIVRLSTRESPVVTLVCRLFNEVLASDAGTALRDNTVMLTYGHDAEITRELSSVCDVRVIWGGDTTVNAIRAVPLPAHATELAFGDRFSFAAIRADAYLVLDEEGRTALAGKFFNDTYWFDQMGCSSPRLVAWVGSEDETARAAAHFSPALRAELDRRAYALDTSSALAKLTFAYRAAIDRPVTAYESYGNELAVMPLATLEHFDREHCGAGLLFQHQVRSLDALLPFVKRRDQTLTHFGFARTELVAFVRALNGHGIDRVVPVGEALLFGRYWDGWDLLQAFTRRVVING